jgi:8-oxo-dGTP diphosphatase
MRVVTVAYWAEVDSVPEPVAGSDASAARMVPVDDDLARPDALAFDHHRIITDARIMAGY